jgi:signal transduction histidine kinase
VLRLGFLLALLAGGVAGIGATQRSLAALQEERELTVRIRDDGSGFDVAAASAAAGRLGLRTMRDRVRAVGGELDIWSSPDAGTEVVVVMR